ncbi:hypothetical protein GY45DRAFT_658968 [Cubamyces sp. BRFM 1775]|nr:hypothetical protein GY45DRAFT_658968 [Cubamyces sp. BRFM 1775]
MNRSASSGAAHYHYTSIHDGQLRQCAVPDDIPSCVETGRHILTVVRIKNKLMYVVNERSDPYAISSSHKLDTGSMGCAPVKGLTHISQSIISGRVPAISSRAQKDRRPQSVLPLGPFLALTWHTVAIIESSCPRAPALTASNAGRRGGSQLIRNPTHPPSSSDSDDHPHI